MLKSCITRLDAGSGAQPASPAAVLAVVGGVGSHVAWQLLCSPLFPEHSGDSVNIMLESRPHLLSIPLICQSHNLIKRENEMNQAWHLLLEVLTSLLLR